MGLRLQHKEFFLTDVLAPLCAISNFNYEQVNQRNFPSAMLLYGSSFGGSRYCDRHLAD